MKAVLALSLVGLILSATGNLSSFNRYPAVKAAVEKYTAGYSSKFTKIFRDGPVYSGDGTAYGMPTNGGNCLFPKLEYYNDMMLAAINKPQYTQDMGCGVCAVVVSDTHPYQPIRVRILDQCPECAHGSLDFSDKAFKALTNMDPARVKITWAVVPCDVDIAGYPALVKKGSPVKFQFKTGSSQWWFQVQVFNTVYPVAALECKVGGQFKPMRRENHNYWVKPDGDAGPGPFSFRVTLADSTVIVADGVQMAVPGDDEGSDFSTGTQTTQ
jgi:expansin (peptidoglycan-binding protein)